MFIGIDFGTSFSQIATMYLGQPLLLLNPGEYGIPSEFYYDRECGILIGQDALDQGQGSAAANLVSEVKMAIIEGKKFKLDGCTFSTKEIVKEIYKALITKAVQVAKKRNIDATIEGIVISVPVRFGTQERKLIRDAAAECLGGDKLPVIAVIKEPVAAAIAYYQMEAENNKHILVYDLGGGTCDIALIKANSSAKEHYTVVDDAMLRIGGRNWDEELVKYITEIFEQKSSIQIKGNVGYEEKIRRTAIQVKHELSDSAKDKAFARVELNGRVFSTIITRATFDEITSHLLRQTLDCIEEIYDANINSCKIEDIICVGGSSNMLQVEEGLKRRFPDCNIRIYTPEHAVAYGATYYANMQHDNGITLADVASLSYGVQTNTHYGYADNRKIISNIILQGTSVPASYKKSYHSIKDGQECVEFDIYESEISDDEFDFDSELVNYIGNVSLNLPPNTKAGHKLLVQLTLNKDGMLLVEASEADGNKKNITINLQEL